MNRSFLEDLAEARPDPGGGAAAAYGVSLGLALATKVARLEMGRKTRDSFEMDFFREMLSQLDDSKADASRLREEDCRAYQKLAAARASENDREMFLSALEVAVLCPVRIAKTAVAGLGLIQEIGRRCRRHLLPDLQVATEFLGAAAEGAHRIAAANFPRDLSSDRLDELRTDLEAVLLEGRARLASVREGLQAGL